MHDPDYLALWVWLLIQANHKPQKEILGGKVFECQPGQFTTGRKQLSVLSGINQFKIERILSLMETEQQITQQTTNTNRLISIINWKDYQQDAQQIAPQMHNGCTTDAQQLHTLEECKELKNEKNNTYTPEFLQFWTAYPRREGKGAAFRAWSKIKAPSETLQLILSALSWQSKSEQWTKEQGQFIPMPATYLNQQRWLDEPVKPQTKLFTWKPQ